MARSGDLREPETLRSLLRPYPADEMECYEVSAKVNSPRYNEPDAITPVGSMSDSRGER